MKIAIKFEPRDCWVGVFWTTEGACLCTMCRREPWLKVYICLIPCFPIVVTL